jgi:hypothetical protein
MKRKRRTRCKACRLMIIKRNPKTPGLCGQCSRGYRAKVNYVAPTDYPLPDDDASDEELLALVSMNYSDESAEIMDKRIERMKAEIQAVWSDKTREKRSVAKKKHQSKLPSFHSSGQGKFRVYEPTSTARI